MTDYLPRELSGPLQKALRSLPVVVVSGPRQCGKTTFLARDPGLKGRRFLSLDDPAVLEVARRDPDRFLDVDGPLTIDEAQKCPELFPALKRAVDRERRNGRYLLSGSANFLLLRSVSESLAGRAVYLSLGPLSQRELTMRTAKPPFLFELAESGKLPHSRGVESVRDERVLEGGFPSVALHEAEDRTSWFTGYEQTYLERDLRDLSQVADLGAFRRVLGLAALRNGQIANEAEIGREAKLPATTTGRYLDLLEASCVVTRTRAFTQSRAARLIKTPKLYVCDSGLAAHLIGIDDFEQRGAERFRGALHETWVAQNLRSILAAHSPRAELLFFNVQGRHEVDFVVHEPRRRIAIEVKAATSFDESDLSGLRALRSSTDRVACSILAYGGREALEVEDGLFVVPTAELLS